MKTYPHATPNGIIQTVELAEPEKVKLAAIGLEAECAGLRSDVQECNERLTKQQADMLERIVKLRAELTNAKELLREIRDDEVNAQDEADKFLRDHQPSELSKLRAELTSWQSMAERLATPLKRAEELASIAYDWDFGKDGKVEIQDEWVSCSALREEFRQALTTYESAKSGNLPDSPLFEYHGKMYMRPCDRGAVLCDIDKQFDNDVLLEGDYKCSIRVWKGGQSCPDCQPANHVNETDFVTKDPLAEAVKRMEAVSEADLIAAYIKRGVNRVRARLISAAKGEQP